MLQQIISIWIDEALPILVIGSTLLVHWLVTEIREQRKARLRQERNAPAFPVVADERERSEQPYSIDLVFIERQTRPPVQF
ncbi:MAG TPA: hypothetical protein VGN72_23995 [Tepidisphaeraceae bacterium]|jgi:hypothetical protein|nr:hypothetical protein [Tepidisphaeraceae bacterium]